MTDEPPPTLPEPPPNMPRNAIGYWITLTRRWEHLDADIRGAEAIDSAPRWLHGRRSERAAIGWALRMISAAVVCDERLA